MPARAYWKGQLRLALVSIPVEIYAATRSGAAIAFRQIYEPSGKPIKYEKTAAGVGPVDSDDIVKGYEISKGNYVLLEDKEIEAVKIESRKTLELVQFVAAEDIDVLYYEKPYFVVPADDLAEEAYIVLREALRAAKKVGVGQLSVRGREQLVSIKPCGRGLVMELLRYADEVQKAQGYFRDIPDAKPDADLLDLATTLIDKKTGPFKPEAFHDRYIEGVKRLVEKKAKAKGKLVLEDADDTPARGGGNIIDLMAALKKSVGESGAAAAKDQGTGKDKGATRKAPAKAPASKASPKPAQRKRA